MKIFQDADVTKMNAFYQLAQKIAVEMKWAQKIWSTGIYLLTVSTFTFFQLLKRIFFSSTGLCLIFSERVSRRDQRRRWRWRRVLLYRE